MLTSILQLALATVIVPIVSAQRIEFPVVLEGRVPKFMAMADLGSIFKSDSLKNEGNSLSWSDFVLFPPVANSHFDNSSYKSLEIQFANDLDENSPGYVGVKTLHWSVKQDPTRALNLTEEYLDVWHEEEDLSSDQFMF